MIPQLPDQLPGIQIYDQVVSRARLSAHFLLRYSVTHPPPDDTGAVISFIVCIVTERGQLFVIKELCGGPRTANGIVFMAVAQHHIFSNNNNTAHVSFCKYETAVIHVI